MPGVPLACQMGPNGLLGPKGQPKPTLGLHLFFGCSSALARLFPVNKD
jgi:hypothetical protein